MDNMNSSVHKGTGRSSGTRVLLRMSGGFLQVCLNIFIYAVIIFFVIKAVHYTYDFAYRIFGNVSMEEAPGHDVKIMILKGETTMNVATKLETNKLIPEKYSFFLKVQIGNFGTEEGSNKYEIMGGTYVLNTSMNYEQILEVITNNKKSIEEEISVEEAENTP